MQTRETFYANLTAILNLDDGLRDDTDLAGLGLDSLDWLQVALTVEEIVGGDASVFEHLAATSFVAGADLYQEYRRLAVDASLDGHSHTGDGRAT